jgi:hypothetical protein
MPPGKKKRRNDDSMFLTRHFPAVKGAGSEKSMGSPVKECEREMAGKGKGYNKLNASCR